MEQESVKIALNHSEWRVIAALRDLPDGQLKDLVRQTIGELLEYAREPKCPEMQADGVPCATPAADCEECRRLKEILGDLRQAMGGKR
jgi:hypothetical protein